MKKYVMKLLSLRVSESFPYNLAKTFWHLIIFRKSVLNNNQCITDHKLFPVAK